MSYLFWKNSVAEPATATSEINREFILTSGYENRHARRPEVDGYPPKAVGPACFDFKILSLPKHEFASRRDVRTLASG